MEIKDIKIVEEQLKNEIEAMGASPNRDILAKERCVPIIKQELELVLLKSIQNLYYLIKEHVSTKGFPLANKLRELNTIEDYQYNLKVLKQAANELKSNVDEFFAGTKKDNSSFMSRYVDSKRDFASFMQEVSHFVDSAVYISQISSSNKTDSAYIRLVSKTLPSMKGDLLKAKSYTNSWSRYGEGYNEIFDSVVEFFTTSSKEVEEFAKDYLDGVKKQKQDEKAQQTIDSSRIVKPTVTSELPKRLRLIKEANDKYEEFCIDFMRDLEKQYALSSKDLYEEFVNVRFKKFVERFPMPISNDVSEGYAQEVINQINIMIEHVSKISQNSYVTSVYAENEKQG